MYKKILVPVDGSPPSMRGLEEAIKIAKACGSKLREAPAQLLILTQRGRAATHLEFTRDTIRPIA